MSKSKKQTLEDVLQACRDSWSGAEGENRAKIVNALIDRVCKEYGQAFGMTEQEVFDIIESQRDYCAVNYYQEAKFPKLTDCKVYQTNADVRAALTPHEFYCPLCKQASSDPQTCNTGALLPDGKPCDWKSYGLFGTMGTGLRFVCVEDFKAGNGRVHEIFMPMKMLSSNNTEAAQ